VDTIYDTPSTPLLTFKETSYKIKCANCKPKYPFLSRNMVAFFDNVTKTAIVAVMFRERTTLKLQKKT
jgi:hypothetical protein